MRKSAWAGLAIAGAALAGAGYYYWRERNSEKPAHRVELADGDFEIRVYPPVIVAETVQPGPRKTALDRGFSILADYIFAKSRGGAPIEMTAPVLSDAPRSTASLEMTAPVLSDALPAGGWRTRFVMPARFTLATLPPPPSGVKLVELPQRRVAAVRFAGTASDESLASHEDDLRAWIAAEGERAADEPEYAFYNSPFIPPPLRRNEVLIPLA